MTQLICAHTLAAVLVAKNYQQHNEGTDRLHELLNKSAALFSFHFIDTNTRVVPLVYSTAFHVVHH